MAKKNKPFRAYFRVVVDKDIFEEAQEILKELNLSIGEVTGLLCNQIVLHRKLPFEIKAQERVKDERKKVIREIIYGRKFKNSND